MESRVKKISFFPQQTCEWHMDLLNFILFCFTFSSNLEETVLVRHPLSGCGGTLSAEFYLFQVNSWRFFLSHSKGLWLSTMLFWNWYQTSFLSQVISIISVMPWFSVCEEQAFPHQITQSVSLLCDRPAFCFPEHLFPCIPALRLTEFPDPVIKIWILCPIACKFFTLHILAPLDKFGWIPFPKCQLSWGIFTWTGPRKAE